MKEYLNFDFFWMRVIFMSLSSGPVNAGNRYRVAWQPRQAAQNDVQDLVSREDAIVLTRNANQMNPGVPHWIERLEAGRFYRDEAASNEAEGRVLRSLLDSFCNWLANLCNARNDEPVIENRVADQPAIEDRVEEIPSETLPEELAIKDKLEPAEQAPLFFPDHPEDEEEATKLFTQYPLIAQDLWNRFRGIHASENGEQAKAEGLRIVRKWTKDHIGRMQQPDKVWELRGLEESL